MSDTGVHSNEVHELGNKNLADPHLQEAYRSSTLRLYTHRLEAIGEVPGWELLRERARELKQEVIEHLDFYLEQFADNVKRNGGKVHWAETADEACRIVLEIAQQCGAREIVKAAPPFAPRVGLGLAGRLGPNPEVEHHIVRDEPPLVERRIHHRPRFRPRTNGHAHFHHAVEGLRRRLALPEAPRDGRP